jgi:hypothetical protein
MKRLRDLTKKPLVIIGISLLLLCGLAPILFIGVTEVESKICYQSVANEYNVQPTYLDIKKALDKKVTTELAFGMDRAEVIAILEQIAPVATSFQGKTLNGGYQELTWLKICSFNRFDIPYLINYSGNNKLQEVIPKYNE